MAPDRRNSAVDLLRGVAAFFIVGVHVVFTPRTSAAWLLHDYCDVGVAVFAALSGYFMPMSVGRSWCAFVAGRFRRLLVPYVIWSVVFVSMAMLSQIVGGGLKDKYSSFSFWVTVVFEGNASTHLWFLIWLFYIQCLLMPVLPRIHPYMVTLLGVSGIGLGTMVSNYYVDYPLRLLSFLLIGFALRTCSVRLGRIPLRVRGAFLFCSLVAFGLLHGIVHVWWLNLMVVAAVVVVVCSNEMSSREGRWAKACFFLGAMSMGVYLVRPLFSVPISRLIARFCDAPYGCGPICLAWLIAYGLSLMAVIGYRRLTRR